MVITGAIDQLVEATLQAVPSVVPIPLAIAEPEEFESPVIQAEIGVLIGMTGALSGQVVIEGAQQTFANISQLMYGMALEGEMLESFVGELSNMILGTTATNASAHGISVDITPPAIIVGEAKLTGFKSGLTSKMSFVSGDGEFRVYWVLQESEK